MSPITEPASVPGLRHAIVVSLSDFEWRDSGNPDSPNETTLRGYAAKFNSLSEDLGGFRELLEPGAFRSALRLKPDVRLLINHDGLPLARTASGTMDLREDPTGLHVFARLDKNDPDVSSLRVKMHRGDVDQMSFAFSLRDDGGDDWAVAEDGTVVRTIRADGVDGLYDVSVVTFPAYPQTTVNIRSVNAAVAAGNLPESLARGLIAVVEAASQQPGAAEAIAPPEGGLSGSRNAGSGALRIARIKARASKTPTPKELKQ